jgi:hypothetical protein
MQVSQRATSEASLSSFGKYPCVDRFHCEGGSSGTFTLSQSTTAPEGFSNSLKFDCTTADASPNLLLISQRFEGQDLQSLAKGSANAKKTTLSFYVRSSKTGTYQVDLRDVDNSRQIGKTYTIDVADTWERKSVTFDGDTTGSFDNDNANSLRIEWWLAAGSTYGSGAVPTAWESSTNADRAAGLNVAIGASTSDDFHLTGVQLELGSVATEFEHRSYGEELALCQRYYERWSSGGADRRLLGGGWGGVLIGQYYVVKRSTAVTVTYSNAEIRDDSNTARTIDSVATSDRSFQLYSSGQTYKTGNLRFSGTGYIAFEAEL